MPSETRTCTTIACYGTTVEKQIAQRYLNVIQWLVEQLNLNPSEMKCSLQQPDGSASTVNLERLCKAPEQILHSRIIGIQIIVRPQQPQSAEYLFSSGLSLQKQYIVVSAVNDLFSSDSSFITHLMQVICEQLAPHYGIAYTAPATNRAIYYALGVSYGSSLPTSEAEWEQETRISRWGHTALPNKVYQDGLLRNVYQWNLLSEQHLSLPIEGIPFAEWVGSSSQRGEILSLNSKYSLWKLDPVEIENIRQVLEEHGLLFK